MGYDQAAAAVELMAVADQAKAWIREAQRLKAKRDQRDRAGVYTRLPDEEDVRPSTPEESRAARLKAMRIAWERRGRPWDEAEALRALAEIETRGETRGYSSPGGSLHR
jgi:hypothetical protein